MKAQRAVDLAIRALGRPFERAVVVFGVPDTEFDADQLRILLRMSRSEPEEFRSEVLDTPGPDAPTVPRGERVEHREIAGMIGSAQAIRLKDAGIVCYRETRGGDAMD